VAAKTSHGVAATASISEKSEIRTRLSGVRMTVARPDGRPVPVAQAISIDATVAALQQIRSFKFRQNGRPMGLHVLPGAPHIRQRREDVGRSQATGGPLPRPQLRRATECVRAEGSGLSGRGAASEKRADEPGEHVSTAARRKTRITAGDDMLRPAKI